MEPYLVLALANLLLGLALGAARRSNPQAGSQALWLDTLLLFFLGSAVCDLIAWLGAGSALGLNAYTLAAGFAAGVVLRRQLSGRRSARA